MDACTRAALHTARMRTLTLAMSVHVLGVHSGPVPMQLMKHIELLSAVPCGACLYVMLQNITQCIVYCNSMEIPSPPKKHCMDLIATPLPPPGAVS